MEAVHSLITRRIEDEDKVSEVMKDFNKKDNDQDRIIKILQVMHEFDVTPIIPSLTKDNSLSNKFRNMGEELFNEEPLNINYFKEILILYSKSIAYAEPLSTELSLAYECRSNLLLFMFQYKECISDIDRALSFNNLPEYQTVKCHLRRIQCLLTLGESINNDLINAINMAKQMPECPRRQKCLRIAQNLERMAQGIGIPKVSVNQRYPVKIPVVKSPNVEVPSASDAVAIEYNSQWGRHIVATRDIEPGELIAVEKSYTYILNHTNCYTHCSNCTEGSFTLLPCDYCYCSMYCSEICRSDHWKKFHEIECPVFSILYEISNDDNEKFNFFCIRLVLQALREFGSIQALKNQLLLLKESNKQRDPRTQGFDSNMQFLSNKYTSIYSLTTNTDKRSSFDIFRRGLSSCTLLYLLVNYSTFFGEKKNMKISEIAEYDDATFIGGLLLTHQQIIPSNAHSLEETYRYDPKQRGMVAMAFYSLFNHSCSANVLRYSAGTSTVMRSIFPIKKGEQLFDNYGYHFGVTVRARRREGLLGQYYFFCECIACKDNWRTDAELPNVKELIKPPIKRSFISKSLKMLDHYIIFLGSATPKIIEERQDILQALLNMLKTLYNSSLYPSSEFINIVETIKYACSMLGNVYYFPEIKEENWA
ncbi:PREDICTED: SET and MYND domain-containing protein 4-like [Polistes dominula]|uniref:Protein-lysine N-methyltransferase SMYD4 n=1 Tax=Polistes dominula TaxID=743375 RepID=A0ABM1JGZ1_POLDO|nr:PREDICTED: SET and MYND domain-containing protein 4-like [Polistes dominula]XP_015191727.1 PREDICTED: SET and MYND domain-containing protein 4-like [Polistes dominula]XP_015191728.1 PREDICTED: SET and MYND domain-containing protein 4-like [Polistes dominula]XP_015191729.1 PREDICTED: SET and MYND domain-containing protein 4-like [Polistes dominula]